VAPYNKSRWKKERPDTTPLLVESIARYRTVYLVINAMDEHSEGDMKWLKFFNELRKFTSHLNILVTSRPSASVEKEFAAALIVEIVAQEIDVLSYVRASLEHAATKKHTRSDVEFEKYIEGGA
jgi:hypothetical protein